MDPNQPRRPRGRARGQSQERPQGQPRGPPHHQGQPRGPPHYQGQPRAPPRYQGPPQGPSPNQGQPRGLQSAQAPASRPWPNMPGQLNPRQEFRPQNVRNIFLNSKNFKIFIFIILLRLKK